MTKNLMIPITSLMVLMAFVLFGAVSAMGEQSQEDLIAQEESGIEMPGSINSAPISVKPHGSGLVTNTIPQDSVLLIPNSTNDDVGMYDPFDGTFLGTLLTDTTHLSTPINAMKGPDGNIYLSDQIGDGGDGVRDFPGGWTPDGSAILTERYSNTTGTSDLYSLAADGSLFQPLGPLGGYGGTGANVSPDGQRIVYSQEITDWYYIWSSEIVVLNADGTGRTVITATEGVFEASPVWTADGRILFTEWVDAGNQISIMDADGSNRELLLAEVGEQLTLSP